MDPATMVFGSGINIASTIMVQSIKGLYGISTAFNDFIDKHINEMKAAENPTISRTGRVMEMAKYGFGLGYLSSVVIIGTGQLLLGNTLSAVTTAATAATLSNPAAMTCAAFGAIYYGWGALSDQERNELIEKLSKGLEIGVELIKSIIRFVIEKTKELLTSKNFEEIKKYVGSAAAVFDKSLGDVTHKLSDMVSDTYHIFKEKAGDAIDKTVDISSSAYEAVKESAGKATNNTLKTVEKITSPKKRKNE
jgi:hypothetical protein